MKYLLSLLCKFLAANQSFNTKSDHSHPWRISILGRRFVPIQVLGVAFLYPDFILCNYEG